MLIEQVPRRINSPVSVDRRTISTLRMNVESVESVDCQRDELNLRLMMKILPSRGHCCDTVSR